MCSQRSRLGCSSMANHLLVQYDAGFSLQHTHTLPLPLPLPSPPSPPPSSEASMPSHHLPLWHLEASILQGTSCSPSATFPISICAHHLELFLLHFPGEQTTLKGTDNLITSGSWPTVSSTRLGFSCFSQSPCHPDTEISLALVLAMSLLPLTG